MAEAKRSLDKVAIDIGHMCVDRNTKEGKMFDALNQQAQKKAGTPEGNFMQQMLGFTEAALVINNTMEGKDAENALAELREAMGSVMA